MLHLLLLSGPIAVGKSVLAKELVAHHGFQTIRSGAYLATIAEKDAARPTLQNLGDALDAQTEYRWLINDVAVPALQAQPAHKSWLLDSVRKHRQIEHFRAQFGQAVFHAHLTAADAILQERYALRQTARGGHDDADYETAVVHPNEVAARSLIHNADVVIDLSAMSGAEAADRLVALLHTGASHETSRTG
jgi:adenylate kinase family enzyme